MRIVIISNGQDPAGVGISLKRAFDRHTEHAVRFVSRDTSFMQAPTDLFWGNDRQAEAEVRDLIRRADVVHMFNDFLPIAEGKPRVIHHHGFDFWRLGPDYWLKEAKRQGIQTIAATHDLALHEGTVWLPNPVAIDEMQALRQEHYKLNVTPLFMQTPTDRSKKHTDAFLEAAEGLNVEVVDRVPWDVSLREKARADVLFDSFRFGYGSTTLEAWGMGIPVVSGARYHEIEDRIERVIGYMPYLSAKPDNLRERLYAIADDESLRRRVAAAGWQCVNDYHSDDVVVWRLLDIYEEAIG